MDAHGRWGALRIWNDDEIAPYSGIPLHAHANTEIITYVRNVPRRLGETPGRWRTLVRQGFLRRCGHRRDRLGPDRMDPNMVTPSGA